MQCEVTARSVLLLRKGTPNSLLRMRVIYIVGTCPLEKAAGAGRCMTSRSVRKLRDRESSGIYCKVPGL